MLEMVEDRDGVVRRFVEERIPGGIGFPDSSGIGYVLDGKLIGGTLFHNFNRESGVCEMTTASDDPRWLSPKTLRAIFTIPFEQWACQMVVLRVSERNERMVKIAQRFGFKGHLIDRLRGRDEAEWVFTLTDDDWHQSKFKR